MYLLIVSRDNCERLFCLIKLFSALFLGFGDFKKDFSLPFILSLSLSLISPFPLYLSFYLSFSLSPSLSLLSIILFCVSNRRFRPCFRRVAKHLKNFSVNARKMNEERNFWRHLKSYPKKSLKLLLSLRQRRWLGLPEQRLIWLHKVEVSLKGNLFSGLLKSKCYF